MTRNSKVSFKECTQAELEKANVVIEFPDNAWGDYQHHGTPHLILLENQPIGWMQINLAGFLNVIEIIPTFQKKEIGTEVILQLYGENPPEETLTQTPCTQAGAKLLRRFQIEPEEILD